eukprot:m.100212 g.100212  ORF g.100212 m.100212 type:complete len:977 (+) comp27227_c1_seq2:308-3238(+)
MIGSFVFLRPLQLSLISLLWVAITSASIYDREWDGCEHADASFGNVTLCHRVDQTAGTLTLGFLATPGLQGATVSWAGVGLSVTGGMKGADMMVATRGADGVTIDVKDYWSEGFYTPTEDFVDDITTHAFGGAAELWFVASRPLLRSTTTCAGKDADADLDVTSASSMFIFAFGYGPFGYHGTRRGQLGVWLNVTGEARPLNARVVTDQSQEVVAIVARPFEIPKTPASTYLCTVIEMPVEERFVTYVDVLPETSLAHHIFLFGCKGNEFTTNVLPDLEEQFECSDQMVPPGCTNMLWGWNKGGTESSVKLRDGVGFSIGGATSYTHAILQIHYDNPAAEEGVVASKDAIVLTHVPANRSLLSELGMLTLGVVPIKAIDPINIPPQREALIVESICPIECTMSLPAAGIEIVYVMEHAHTLGRSLGLEIHRGDEIIPITHLTHWDYLQGSNVQPPITPGVRIMPGDRLRKWCTYDSRNKTNTTVGGQTTDDEMCEAYVWTTPPSPFSWCIDLKDTAYRYAYGLDILTSKLPASCFTGYIDLSSIPEPGAPLSLDGLLKNTSAMSAVLDSMSRLTFYDPIANAVTQNPPGRCGPSIPGVITQPPPRVSNVEPLEETSVSFALASSACGPGNRETDYTCPQPSSITLSTSFWLVSVVVGFGCLKWFFRSVTDVRLQRNVVAYIMNLIVTTVSIIVVLAYASPLLFNGEDIDNSAQQMTWFFTFHILWLMTFWELIYRIDINPSLLAHHICTIALCLVFAISLYDIEHDLLHNAKEAMLAYIRNDADEGNAIRKLNEQRHGVWITVFRLGLIVIMGAWTEQPSFIALLAHRGGHPRSRSAFYAAAVWSGVTKTTFFIWGAAVFVTKRVDHDEGCADVRWCQPWTVIYPILYTMLFVTQIWATYILFVLSKRTSRSGVRVVSGADALNTSTHVRTSQVPTLQPTLQPDTKEDLSSRDAPVQDGSESSNNTVAHDVMEFVC